MSATCFDKAFGGAAATLHALWPTWQPAKDCSRNPAGLGRPFVLQGVQDLAGWRPVHLPAGQNRSNCDAEKSWRRDYIKKSMDTTLDQRSRQSDPKTSE